MFTPLIKKPSAWVPLAMSLAALTLALGYLALFGWTHESQADEGVAARLFQLLLGGQLPFIGFFAIKWFSRLPRQALRIIALQILAALIPFTLVFFLNSN